MEGAGFKEILTLAWNYLWFIVIALLGGTANYISRVKRKGLPFSSAELVGEWVISGFAGITTVNICLSHNMNIHITAAAAGIAGHMGGRLIFMFEHWLVSKLPGHQFKKGSGESQGPK